VIDAIDGIRTIRGESNLKPALKIEAHLQTDDAAVRGGLDANRAYIMALAGLSKLTIEKVGTKPPQAAAEVREQLEISVPLAGIVDLAEERERLKKEIVKVEAEVALIQRKFENPNYASKAPPDVVENDRARIAELTSKIAKVRDNLARIAPVEVRVAPPSAGSVNLEEELREELSGVNVPVPDQQVKEALEKLREGTKEGLTSRDHYDLGVAYINMGLVDDAVREFNAAKEDEPKPKKPAAAKKSKAVAARGKKPASAKKPPARKPAAKKAKVAVPKKSSVLKKASAPKKASVKSKARAKPPVKKAAAAKKKAPSAKRR
jgi:valyl-tRNA synthetase